MKPVVSKHTETSQRRTELNSLAVSLGMANTHFYLAEKLNDGEKQEFRNELYKSLDFWDYTIRAHFQAAMLHLCRLYDTQKSDAHHLLSFLEAICEAEKKKQKLAPEQKDQLKADLIYLQRQKPDLKVARLRIMRNNIFSHLNYDFAIEGLEFFEKKKSCVVKVDLQEIRSLIEEGFLILERWAFYYDFKGEFPRLVERKDDYLFVLESLKLRLRQQKTTTQKT